MQHKRQGQKILWPPSILAHISHSWDSAHHIVWKLSTHAATKQSQATNFVTRCAHEISISHYLYPNPVASSSSATAAAGFGYDRDQVKTGESDIIMLLVISSGDGSWCNIAAPPSSPCRALDLSARHRSISRFRLRLPRSAHMCAADTCKFGGEIIGCRIPDQPSKETSLFQGYFLPTC